VAYRDFDFDSADDPLGDDEDPDEPDYEDDESETVPCPNCGASLYEDADYCPRCNQYVTPDTSAWSGRPLWWIVLGLAGVAALVLALSRGW
jgi:hypothetical protein